MGKSKEVTLQREGERKLKSGLHSFTLTPTNLNLNVKAGYGVPAGGNR